MNSLSWQLSCFLPTVPPSPLRVPVPAHLAAFSRWFWPGTPTPVPRGRAQFQGDEEEVEGVRGPKSPSRPTARTQPHALLRGTKCWLEAQRLGSMPGALLSLQPTAPRKAPPPPRAHQQTAHAYRARRAAGPVAAATARLQAAVTRRPVVGATREVRPLPAPPWPPSGPRPAGRPPPPPRGPQRRAGRLRWCPPRWRRWKRRAAEGGLKLTGRGTFGGAAGRAGHPVSTSGSRPRHGTARPPALLSPGRAPSFDSEWTFYKLLNNGGFVEVLTQH